ncbi:R3H and coiled-coil domain-containing protein 1 isoform X2 [Colius striatus]|nr:R3H and coiled-coil domain-containing protein 1 isoform X2 [Colius striatus]XP_061871800.1 R3H and coiled-coil domain-containing protein 1 isoform X2 [Colius striatus]
MDGVFLSPNEDEFVGRITEELEHFMLQGQHDRVLLFPPLSSRLRYLIHRTVENLDLLSSFSVGEGWRRRTVICHSAVRLPSEANSDSKPSSNAPRAQRPPQPWGRGGRGARPRHAGDAHGDGPRGCVGSGRIKRPPWKKPDKILYVPKGRRKKAEWGEQESPVAAGAELEGDVAREERICPKASSEDAQEEVGKREGSPSDVSSALGKQQEPGEECVSGKNDDTNKEHPPSRMDVPSLESSNYFSGQDHQDKNCSDAISSVHSKLEEQDLSCHNIEGNKLPCQLQAEDQNRQDAHVLEHGKTSSSESSSHSVEPSAVLVLESQERSCAATQGDGNVAAPEEQGKELVNGSTAQGGRSLPQLESPDQECPSTAQVEQDQKPSRAPNEPVAAPEPVCGADSSAPDGPVQIHSGKVPVEEEEEQEKEGLGLANTLRELRLSAGDREESARDHGHSSLEDDCTTELFAEIVGHLTVKDISIERISCDYSSYGDAQPSEGDLGHVTEIYDFSPSLKTEHLLEVFSDFHEGGFKIQWVDDTHALGIFSSPSAASQALGRRYSSLKIRPLIHATKQSKIKALQRPKLLHLGKERPQTDTAVARRLVSRALGWRHRQQDPSSHEALLPDSLDQEE